MDSAPPRLSVVISAYNYAQFLPVALESVLSQEPAFDEVIVVNDGSTDATREVLAPYESRVKVIHTENQGQIAACLEGARAATSDYVYLLDADDYVAPGMVATVRPVLASRPAKVQFQLEGVDINCQPLGSVFPTYPANYSASQMREDNQWLGFYQCPPTSGNVVDRRLLVDCGLDPQATPPHIDATGMLIQPYLGEVISLPQRLAFYRVHGSNMFNTGWSYPDAKQLRKELREFDESWTEALRVLQLTQRPFANSPPMFVLERELMIGALDNRPWLLPTILRYIRKLLRTHLPAYSKLLLATWAVAFAWPSAKFRQQLIHQRRNPEQRGRWIRSFVRPRTHSRAASEAGQTPAPPAEQWQATAR